ncbi:MAG: dATP/dGTP diphosphohydrolase domain-containing protein [Nitrospiraceae bacterium]
MASDVVKYEKPELLPGEGVTNAIQRVIDSNKASLPTDSQERKDTPIVSGCLDYFGAALQEVARLSKYGNDKHNPGEELHHARGKSTDHADCIVRHLMERGTEDPSGFSHTVMVAWRALALLQEELEAAGAPLARGARED